MFSYQYRTALAISLLACFAAPALAETSAEARLQELELRLNVLENQKRAATTFGGYGELHLNKLKSQNGGTNKDELDMHRFVLFIGHQFDERVRFFSELEVEHNTVEGGNGAVELEQAYLDFALDETLNIKAGSFLIPAGINNETHEPPTFYGVERNPVETNIIPATWWEGGAGISARYDNGVTLDAAITSGMKADAADNYDVRKARQELAEGTLAKNPAYTVRMKWTGIPGVELAATLHHQTDITQSADTTAGAATLFETHAVINQGAFGMRALYAGWNLDGTGPKALGADKQNGWYVEPAWKFSEQWGVFARHSRWDNKAGDATDSAYRQTDFGVNFWPHPDVVVKLDYQNQTTPAAANELDGFNLGLGYQF